MFNASPIPAVKGRFSGCVACAAIPVNRDLVLSDLNFDLIKPNADLAPIKPNLAVLNGCFGNLSGPKISSIR